MTDARINFFGLSEDKLYYDERRKRFVNLKNAPAHIERSYKNNSFKDVYKYFTNLHLATTGLVW